MTGCCTRCGAASRRRYHRDGTDMYLCARCIVEALVLSDDDEEVSA